jgi:predicted  nucleic acid-binding Zn-ribbon protein
MTATLTNATAEISDLTSRYSAVAGRTSILRAAIARIEREMDAINEAVDAEVDGAEVDFARLPALRTERNRLAALLAPLSAEEQYTTRALAAYGIATS